MNILLVDDDQGILETLVDIFEDMGFHIETASTGRQALNRLQDHAFHLALLDIRLPDMQGTELLAYARERQPDLKCIMATGNASLPSALESLNQGAYAYLQKPIEVPHVKATVRRALEQQKLETLNRRLLEQLMALGDITDAALATLEINELLSRVLEKFVSHHGADGGVIYLYDPQSQQLIPRIVQGPPTTVSAEPLEVGQGLTGKAAETGEVQSAFADQLQFDPIAARGVQSAVAAPLRWRDQLLGAVRLDRLEGQPFETQQLDQLRLFSARAGDLIGNARLYNEERLLHAEAQALADFTNRLVDRVGVGERLDLMGRFLMRETGASRCLIWLVTRDSLSCAHVLGVTDQRVQRVLQRVDAPMSELSQLIRETLDLGGTVQVAGEELQSLVAPNIWESLGITSSLLVPLRFEGRAIGLVSLDQPGVERRFSPRQVRQARLIADVSAGAIQQARTIQEERETLRTLAESFLTRPPRRPDLDLADRYEPASVVAQVGGDYYDFIEIDDHHLGVVIGDVCGKERAAAIYVAMAKYMLRAYCLEDPSPRQVITRLNRALYNQMSEECMFITMVYGVLDLREGTFTYTNAGHPPPILYYPESQRTMELKPLAGTNSSPEPAPDPSGRPRPTDGMVGAIAEMEFTETTVPLEHGSVLAMFTDGVTEARTNHEMLESAGVQAVIRDQAAGNADIIATAIYDRALQFASGLLRDDVAIIVAKYP